MINWMNDNEGFLMVIITFVYVVATGLICYFNGKSAGASRKQIEEAQNQQRQNVGIQLYGLRKSVMEKILLRQLNSVYVDMSLLFPTELFDEYKAVIDKENTLKDIRGEVKSFETTLNNHELTISSLSSKNEVAKLQQLMLDVKKLGKYEDLKKYITKLIKQRKPIKEISEQEIDHYISMISKEQEIDAQITKDIAAIFLKMQSFIEKTIQ